MGLTMNTADIAVSRQGIEKFMSYINTNANYAKKRVYYGSDGFRNMVNTINQFWVGTDATNFINDLNTASSEITSLFNEIYGRLRSAFDQYYSSFLRLQQNTYTKGSIRIR